MKIEACDGNCFRNAFLKRAEIQEFVKYLIRLCEGEGFEHTYSNRETRKTWKCTSLQNAFEQYRWDGKEFSTNKIKLDKWSSEIRKIIDASEEITDKQNASLLDICEEVQKWGGTDIGGENSPNIVEIRRIQQEGGLVRALRNVRDILSRFSIDGDERPLATIRSNAGFSKIYSLALTSYIIYDSRVAAALGLITCRYLISKGHSAVPAELKFGRMVGYESKGAKNKKNRDASSEVYRFPITSGDPKHLLSNIHANWVLTKVCESIPNVWGMANLPEKLRALEASLFMIGYDLPRNPSLNIVAVCSTPARRAAGLFLCHSTSESEETPEPTSKLQQARLLLNSIRPRPKRAVGLRILIETLGLKETTASSYFAKIMNELS